jgi:hypothetical protein
MLAATNFVMEISTLPISAAMIIFFDPEAIEKLIEYLGVFVNNRKYL